MLLFTQQFHKTENNSRLHSFFFSKWKREWIYKTETDWDVYLFCVFIRCVCMVAAPNKRSHRCLCSEIHIQIWSSFKTFTLQPPAMSLAVNAIRTQIRSNGKFIFVYEVLFVVFDLFVVYKQTSMGSHQSRQLERLGTLFSVRSPYQ